MVSLSVGFLLEVARQSAHAECRDELVLTVCSIDLFGVPVWGHHLQMCRLCSDVSHGLIELGTRAVGEWSLPKSGGASRPNDFDDGAQTLCLTPPGRAWAAQNNSGKFSLPIG